jgi:hypothetical protein
MTHEREYLSGKTRKDDLEKKVEDRKDAQKTEDAILADRVRESIEKHGA